MNGYLAENEILNSGLNGIRLDWAVNTTITGNKIQNSGENGIRVYESRNNTISKNIIEDNKANGIYLQTYSFLNLILLNNITSNAKYGINTGQYSATNLIHHNNFVDNGNQATNYPGETNTWGWDNGFPSGGNYWSDYDGQDNNDDGIGDTPYIIDENNQDKYPLMNPADISTSQKFSTIPEFPSWVILPLVLTVTVVVAIYKKKLTKHHSY
jgi:parallel beta-helix repeat protein